MLTKDQRSRLDNRANPSKVTGQEKRYNDMMVRKHLTKHLDSVKELIHILDVLPKDQTRSLLKDEHVAALFLLSEQIMGILGYHKRKIYGDPNDRGSWHVIWRDANDKILSDLVNETDIKRSLIVRRHNAILQAFRRPDRVIVFDDEKGGFIHVPKPIILDHDPVPLRIMSRSKNAKVQEETAALEEALKAKTPSLWVDRARIDDEVDRILTKLEDDIDLD